MLFLEGDQKYFFLYKQEEEKRETGSQIQCTHSHTHTHTHTFHNNAIEIHLQYLLMFVIRPEAKGQKQYYCISLCLTVHLRLKELPMLHTYQYLTFFYCTYAQILYRVEASLAIHCNRSDIPMLVFASIATRRTNKELL